MHLKFYECIEIYCFLLNCIVSAEHDLCDAHSLKSFDVTCWSIVQSLSHARLCATPWTAAQQTSLSFTISQSLLKLMSIELVMPYNHLILCHPFLLLPLYFQASGSFPVSWLFASSGQSIGTSASASALPVNTQD